MKTALKLYFLYVPKWYFIYLLIQTVVSSLLSLSYGILIPATVASYFAGTTEFKSVVQIIAFVLFFDLFILAIGKIVGYFMTPKLNYVCQKEVNMLLFRKMNQISLQYYDDSQFYDKYNLANKNTLPSIYASIDLLLSILGQLISIGSMLTLILLIDPPILLFMIGCAIVSVIIQIIESIFTLKLQKESVNINHIFEYISRTFYLKKYALDQRFTKISDVTLALYQNTIVRVKKYLDRFMKRAMPWDCLDAGVTDIFIYFSILIFSCYRIAVLNQYAVGDLVAILTSSITLFRRLSGIGGILSQLFDINKKMSFFSDFMAYPDDYTQKGQQIKDSFKHEIEVQNLCFSYQEKKVLNNITLKIPVGSILALIGPNGAGKSTLVKLLRGLYHQDSGYILIDGVDSRSLSEHSFSHLFMVVNQAPVIYEMSIAENILLKPCESAEDAANVWDLLQKVGLKDKIMQYENGFHTIIGREFHPDGIELSGGEMQKIAIARCLASKNKILILDEPSSHLDPISEHQLFELLISLKKELTFIVITHNIQNIVDADQIVWLENGNVEEIGSHFDLMKLGKKYAAAFNSLYNTLR